MAHGHHAVLGRGVSRPRDRPDVAAGPRSRVDHHAVFLRPHTASLGLGVALVLVRTGLEIVGPMIVRYAIDDQIGHGRTDLLPVLVAAYVGALGCRLYLVTRDQRTLQPLPLDRGDAAGQPLSLDGTVAGRAFRTSEVVVSTADVSAAWILHDPYALSRVGLAWELLWTGLRAIFLHRVREEAIRGIVTPPTSGGRETWCGLGFRHIASGNYRANQND